MVRLKTARNQNIQRRTFNAQRPRCCAEIIGEELRRRPCASLGVGVLAARELPPPMAF